jgi:phosphatidylglycerol:prolipoprotein diacylglycerol transferase
VSEGLPFPRFDPVLLRIGPLAIRWYALAYIAGLLIGTWLVRKLVQWRPAVALPDQVSDFLTWATLGVVLGGRFGYVLFYQPTRFLARPWEIVEVWGGGMSFHGGMLGVALAIMLFCRRYGIPVLGFADRIAVAAPIGLFLGRVANFINGELWGRKAPDGLWWAMIFPDPRAGGIARYPSQLYQAGMEGLILFGIMMLAARSERLRSRYGTLTGIFLCGYATARIIGELFREPDDFLHWLPEMIGATMGQLLSLPMFLAGLVLIVRARPVAARA